VLGQQQGTDLFGAQAINTTATVEDDDVGFYKPLVKLNNNDHKSPAQLANMLKEQQRAAKSSRL